jgi:hypothetical protein
MNEYFSMDPHFPDRLMEAGTFRVLQYIKTLIQEFSQRQLTDLTDRSVAFSGLENRIANAIKSESRYGIPQLLIHDILLWQRQEPGQLNRIKYSDPNKPVPSWSWMACSDPIKFDSGRLRYQRTALCFDENSKNVLLAAEGATFIDCKLKGDETTKEILNQGGGKIGWIQYDILEDIPEFNLQRCIVVGKGEEKYVVLLVKPSSLKDEYTRIGTGMIEGSYLSRIEGIVRVV